MIRIDVTSPTPLVEQITDEIRRAIAAGDVTMGDSLPPVRQLAADLGVNLNTVARSYRALEAKGLIRTRRGQGTIVCAEREANTGQNTEEIEKLRTKLEQVLSDARLRGLSAEDAREQFEKTINRFW